MMKHMGWQLWAAPIAAVVMSVATACGTDVDTTTATAHVEIAVPKAFSGVITRMSVQVDGGDESDLDASSGQFTGLLMVPAGTRTFVGRAYDASGALVGKSQPLQAAITAGVIQGVQLMILDVSTQAPSQFGPAIAALTYPETGEVNQPYALSVTAIDPDGDPVAIQWTTTCADATFGDPAAASTTWTRPTTGACAITVAATASGFTVSRTFNVVVFPAGSQQGGVKVTGQFVPGPVQPQLTMYSTAGSPACFVTSGTVDRTCQNLVHAGDLVSWGIYAYDGNANTLGLSDNCGGTFSPYADYGYQKYFYWYSPAGKSSCIVTATVTNASGATSSVQAGVVFIAP